MTIINIGTSKKDIVNVKLDKEYNDICFKDIIDVVKKELGDIRGIKIFGWGEVKNDSE
jgi:hypothetical protein